MSWRKGDDYTGGMPLPPDQAFLSGGRLSFGVDLGPISSDFYRRWYGSRVDVNRFYVFVDNRHLVERDYRRFRVPRERVVIIINRTRPVTRFEVVNNRVVNRGVDVRVIERASGRRIAPVSAKVVIKSNAVITTVNEAQEIRQRERVQHPIEAERRGPAAGRGDDKENEKATAAETNTPAGGGVGAGDEGKQVRDRNRDNTTAELRRPAPARAVTVRRRAVPRPAKRARRTVGRTGDLPGRRPATICPAMARMRAELRR